MQMTVSFFVIMYSAESVRQVLPVITAGQRPRFCRKSCRSCKNMQEKHIFK